jgi:predicted alpha/beta hydrolase family esterase
MKPRIIYIHGNYATHWSFAWATWLKTELEKLGFDTFFETFPDSVMARSEYWLPFMQDHIKIGENDVVIGWSSGGTALMRYAETHKVRGALLIAPSCTNLGDEMEKQSGYYDTPWQWHHIKENVGDIAFFYSESDPFIPQSDFEETMKYLQPQVINVPNGGHFLDQTTFPEVVKYIKDHF